MDCVKDAKVCGDHVILPNDKIIKLYKVENGLVKINPRFSQLWNMLQWTGDYEYPGPQNSLVVNTPLPNFSTSTLVSTTRNEYDVITWDLLGIETGPVSSGGLSIDLRGDSVYYRIYWKAGGETTLGFFSEMIDMNGFIPVTTIDGKLGIFSGTSGCFEIWDYENLYVTSSKDVGVQLFIQIVIPKPEVLNYPTIEWLYFQYDCQKYRFKVADLVILVDGSTVRTIVDPKLRRLQDLIHDTVMTLQLPAAAIPMQTSTLLQASSFTVFPRTLFFVNGIMAGFTTFYTSTPGQIDYESILVWYPRFLGMSVFPDEDVQRTRTVRYNIRLNNPLAKAGDIVSVRLMRKDAQFSFVPQMDIFLGNQIFMNYVLPGPITNYLITGTLTMQRSVTDVIVNVRFREDYPVLGEEDNGTVIFDSLTCSIE